MSRLKYILTIILAVYIGLVQAQYTSIPDPIFEQFLISQFLDDVMDGQVLTANISDETFLQINETDPIFPIEDLTGIQDFISLETLVIAATNCSVINFGNLSNLKFLSCSMNNNLEIIDISGCTDLEELRVANNNLELLDISNNLNINIIDAVNNNLNIMDIRNGFNIQITDFFTLNNPSLTCIFVDDAEFSTANWTDIDPTTTFVETETECEALSTEDFVSVDFSIYPNPTSQFFEIQSNQQITQIQIVDLSGKVIKFFEQDLEKYLVSDLSEGLYILTIHTDFGKSSQKLIVK